MPQLHRLGLLAATAMIAPLAHAAVPATGTWFSPATPGQGLVVEQLAGTSALMFWHGADASAEPTLLYVDALADGDRLAGQAFRVHGPRFGEFDPVDLRFDEAGEVALRLTGCDNGVFQVEPGETSGSALPTAPRGTVQRLAVAGPECDGATQAGPLGRMTGTWAHPQLAGQGISVQFLDADTALVFWHTFDSRGRARLLFLEGEREGNRLTGTVYAGRDGLAPGFVASGLPGVRWGEAEVEFLDCERATLNYQPGWNAAATDGPAGTFPLLRLTVPEGVDCATSAPLPDGFGRRFEGSLRTGSELWHADGVLTSSGELIVSIAGRGTFRGGLTAEATPQLVLDGFARSRTLVLDSELAEISAELQDDEGDAVGRLRLQRRHDDVPARNLDGWAGRFGPLTLSIDGRFTAELRTGGLIGLSRDVYEGSIDLHADGRTFDASAVVTHYDALGERRVRYFGAGWFANDGPNGRLQLHQRLRSVDGQRSLSVTWLR